MSDVAFLPYLDEISKAAVGLWKRCKFLRGLFDYEDAIQMAYLYCLKYGERYYTGKIAKDHYWRQMARQGVWNGSRNEVSRSTKIHLPLVTPLGKLSKGSAEFDLAHGYDTGLYLAEVSLDLATTFRLLSTQEKQILIWFYGIGCPPLSALEIGRRTGIGTYHVYEIMKKSLGYLRSHFRMECES